MEHIFINEIEPGEAIANVHLAREPTLRRRTRRDLYMMTRRRDAAAAIAAVISRVPGRSPNPGRATRHADAT